MPGPAAYNSPTAHPRPGRHVRRRGGRRRNDARWRLWTMAQGPPVFPSFQDQRRAAVDEDEQYFAGLRAAPDEEDPFARPRRDDSWARHPSGGWATTGSERDDFDAVRPRTDEFESLRPGSDAYSPERPTYDSGSYEAGSGSYSGEFDAI